MLLYFSEMNLKIALHLLIAFGFSLIFGLYINGTNVVPNSCVECHQTDPDRINVHLVHHSHNDVGWLKTFDQYYWGVKNGVVSAGVQYIITSVVNSLWDFPDRKFIQVETAFFWKWWQNQNAAMRNKFRTLVENGQIEMVNGGWSMNDEACVNYQSVIDQFTWGFRIINDTLGECGNPTIGWQIDSFGHSREHASILHKIGFAGVFFTRLDQNDRNLRQEESNLDFLWKTSANKDDSIIFGGIFPSEIYYGPSGFCFDYTCSFESINDNPEDSDYNLDAMVNDFANNIQDYVKFYKTNHVLVTMGGDFYFQAAEMNFENSDRLIRGFENHPDIKLLYSTPSCYLKSVYEAKPILELKTDDFFPYGSDPHTYWAGYFTSRQNLKRSERIGHNILQVAKQLNAIAQATGQEDGIDVKSLNKLSEAMGLLQHHDAITGTEKQLVANDYAKILFKGVSEAEESFSKIIGNVLKRKVPELSSCLLANMSICTRSQSLDRFVVIVYNPLSWPVDHVIRLPVESRSFSVTGPTGNISYDVVDPISDFSYVELDGIKPAKRELVFTASQIPAMGVQSYSIVRIRECNKLSNKNRKTLLKFGNEDIGFELDSTTNLLKSVTMNGKTLDITQQFLYYSSGNRYSPSGAYVFKPNGEATALDNPTIVSRVQGDVADEVKLKFNDWITQIIRVYKGTQRFIEFDWLVGPLDVSDLMSKEVISRFTVNNFQNNGAFYTDSNGRETIQRIRNYRPTFRYDPTLEPISSNYYPVTSKISIRDEEKQLQFSVLNDRSQGGSSLREGQIELMVHRCTYEDDGKGVDEALNEKEFGQGIVARGQHYLVIGSSNLDLANKGKTLSAQERIIAQQKLLQPWVGLGDASQISKDDVDQLLSTVYSTLNENLPENINILTFEPWTDSTYILRLEHILERNEDSNLSSSVTVDLTNLFVNFIVENVIETTLGANQLLQSVHRYDWNYGENETGKGKYSLNANGIELFPMDIRTFIVELRKRE